MVLYVSINLIPLHEIASFSGPYVISKVTRRAQVYVVASGFQNFDGRDVDEAGCLCWVGLLDNGIAPMIWASVKRLFRIRLLFQRGEQTLHDNAGGFGGQVKFG